MHKHRLQTTAVVPKLFQCADHFKNFSGPRSTKNHVVLLIADHLSKSRGPLVVRGADFGNHCGRVSAHDRKSSNLIQCYMEMV